MNSLFSNGLNMAGLIACEKQRETIQRTRRGSNKRLTFDCLHCHECQDNHRRAYCQKGHPLDKSQDGTMQMVSVLWGRTARICLLCSEFDG